MNKNDLILYYQGGAADFPPGAMYFPIRNERVASSLTELLDGVIAKNLKTGVSFVIDQYTYEGAILDCAIKAANGYMRLPITDKCTVFFSEVEQGVWHAVTGNVEPWSLLIHDVPYGVLVENDEHAFCGFNLADTPYWRERWGLN